MVQTLSSDIEKQELIAGEIRSCVSIADAKRIWQRLAALQIRRLETENRLLTLIQLLEEQQDLPQVLQFKQINCKITNATATSAAIKNLIDPFKLE